MKAATPTGRSSSCRCAWARGSRSAGSTACSAWTPRACCPATSQQATQVEPVSGDRGDTRRRATATAARMAAAARARHPGAAGRRRQWAVPDHPAPASRPGMLGAAHKPGAMPLRPLGLGDIYDAAFRIIRFNPKATVGVGGAGRRGRDGDPDPRHRRPDRRRRLSPRTSGGDLDDRPSWSASSARFGALAAGRGAPVVRDAAGDRDDRPRHRGRRDRPPAHARRGLGGDPRQALAADRPHRAARADDARHRARPTSRSGCVVVLVLPTLGGRRCFGVVTVPAFVAVHALVLDPGLLPAGAGADDRADRRVRRRSAAGSGSPARQFWRTFGIGCSP